MCETRDIVDIDVAAMDAIVEENGAGPGAAIPILRAIGTRYRYLPNEASERVRELSEIKPASIKGVAAFYTEFLWDRVP